MADTSPDTMTLDELVARLREVYANGLRAVVTYGGEAGDAARTDRADTSVLVVVDAITVELLVAVAGVTREWTAGGKEAPLTLTAAEWRSSADVYSIEYADLLERHEVVYGALPLEGIVVQPADIRDELEEHLLGKLLKLRRGVMEAGGEPERERHLLEVSLGTFVTLLRAVLRLHRERPPTDPVELLARVGAVTGADTAPFTRVVRHVRGDRTLQPGEARPVLAGYLAALEQLVAHVDRIALDG